MKTAIVSIPHTGTIFTQTFLEEVLGYVPYQKPQHFIAAPATKKCYARLHITNEQEMKRGNILFEYIRKGANTIIPLRHPYDNAVSCIARSHNNLIFCETNWQLLLETKDSYSNVFYLPVSIDVDAREKMMKDLMSFLNAEPKSEALFKNFIANWIPKNSLPEDNSVKSEYKKTGVLPEGYDYSNLEEAVFWYEKFLKELEDKYSICV